MGDITEAVTPSTAMVTTITPSQSRPLPIREDCWSEEATSTLVDTWGGRYVELNRGNLRQKDWQEVADAVNALHGHTKKTHRTDVQCKNRIDTIKKKYKVEKARVVSSNGTLTSNWIFYERMDALIGSTFPANKPTPPRNVSPSSPPVALPIVSYKGTPSAAGIKRSSPAGDGGFFKRNYSAMAAAAAAEETESEDEDEDEVEDVVERGGEGVRRLVRAIERFGEVYEKVEREKLRQMMDLEKQRMKFAKDLEMERMRIFNETQIQLERIKKGGVGGKQQRHQRPASVSNGERDY